MFAPIYFPPAAPPSGAVLAAERAILDAEGHSHVAGRYIADPALAATARRQEAERRVAAAERAEQADARWLAAHRCPWCGRPVVPGEPYEVITGEPVHARPCLVELDEASREQDDRRAFECAMEREYREAA